MTTFNYICAIAVAGCAVSWLGIATGNDQAWATGGIVGLVALLAGLWMLRGKAGK